VFVQSHFAALPSPASHRPHWRSLKIWVRNNGERICVCAITLCCSSISCEPPPTLEEPENLGEELMERESVFVQSHFAALPSPASHRPDWRSLKIWVRNNGERICVCAITLCCSSISCEPPPTLEEPESLGMELRREDLCSCNHTLLLFHLLQATAHTGGA